ncbi:MAG: hypothetical protein IPH32_19140 [Bacteroidetes bacterium]|nr:hypothetical protein [Bacteroidota bacterium]
MQESIELYYFKELDMKSIAEEMGYKNADAAKEKYECFKKLAVMVKKNLMILVFKMPTELKNIELIENYCEGKLCD